MAHQVEPPAQRPMTCACGVAGTAGTMTWICCPGPLSGGHVTIIMPPTAGTARPARHRRRAQHRGPPSSARRGAVFVYRERCYAVYAVSSLDTEEPHNAHKTTQNNPTNAKTAPRELICVCGTAAAARSELWSGRATTRPARALAWPRHAAACCGSHRRRARCSSCCARLPA